MRRLTRPLAALVLLLLCAITGRATIALVQSAGKDAASTTSTTLAYSSNIGASHFLAVIIRAGGSSTTRPFTVSDSLSNSYTGLTAGDDSGQGAGQTQLFWAISNGAGADTVTVTLNTANTIRLAIFEYSGTATSNPIDVENNSQSGSSPPSNASSITPASNNELVIAFVSIASTTTATAGSNFTLEQQVPAAPNSKLVVQDWIQTTATATTGTMTLTNGTAWGEGIAAVKPAGAAAAPTKPPVVLTIFMLLVTICSKL